eukprot:SAG11_NODE_418_length_9653_cov_2.465564_2_plen_118_part_00
MEYCCRSLLPPHRAVPYAVDFRYFHAVLLPNSVANSAASFPFCFCFKGVSTSAAHGDLAEQVARAKAAGLCCRTSGIGPPTAAEGYANLARAVAAGADGTTIDWPIAARAWLEQRRP